MSKQINVNPPLLPPIPRGPVEMSHTTEELIQCPYNPAHTIRRCRMTVHLHKCQKQNMTDDWAICSHNQNHHVPRIELEVHENHMCPDRHSFQAMPFSFEATPTLIPIEKIELPDCGEDWDSLPLNHFNPAENAKKNSLIRGVHCVPPSERKYFRSEHRQHILNNEDVLTKAKLEGGRHNGIAGPSTVPKDNNHLEPLRTPKDLPKGFGLGRGKTSGSSDQPATPGWGRGRPQN